MSSTDTMEQQTARPLQIVKTGEHEEDYFILQEENLKQILQNIPPETKVAIVAVVGAFRTGKSFLLNFFLRYLRCQNVDNTASWMTQEGPNLLEGNQNEGATEDQTAVRKASFAWRGGDDRQTTGIWMWSEPFIRTLENGERIAVLLMDTQGMFDNETTMTLTAQIFGLSTLVSSYQIYNVDKRIQEDNLQHLALFSEYGRMALSGNADTPGSVASLEPTVEVTEQKPFQKLQFLVRDWQNFAHDFEEGSDDALYETLRRDMKGYLNKVLASRAQSDLQSTREQILRCFEEIDCFHLPPPGYAVTRINFDGAISKIEPCFRALMDRYVRSVFDDNLKPKIIAKRQITAGEVFNFFEVYVKMFQEGQKSFPKAMTMLDATAEANNRNAHDMSLNYYKAHMNEFLRDYVKEAELTERHEVLFGKALEMFDEIATMGSKTAIDNIRQQLITEINDEYERFQTTNALRNPFHGAELLVIPIAVAIVSWVLSVITDWTCSTDFCEAVEDTFVNIYLFIFFAVVFLMWKQISGALSYVKDAVLPILLAQAQAKK